MHTRSRASRPGSPGGDDYIRQRLAWAGRADATYMRRLLMSRPLNAPASIVVKRALRVMTLQGHRKAHHAARRRRQRQHVYSSTQRAHSWAPHTRTSTSRKHDRVRDPPHRKCTHTRGEHRRQHGPAWEGRWDSVGGRHWESNLRAQLELRRWFTHTLATFESFDMPRNAPALIVTRLLLASISLSPVQAQVHT